jgi:UDP-N-acetylglucosamine--N-acetylmuramyl-(pentapeptide) pyrophosphoryl-undecaprenol N-acetylglucosamine transferase
VAEELRRSVPDDEVVFVGRRGGVAEDLVARAGIRLELLDIRGLHLSNPLSAAGFALRMPGAVRQARRLIRASRAQVVVGAAGYVCVPVVLAARREGVPVVLLEQNAVPGRAVRLLARRASRVAVSFAETAALLPGARVTVTGNPVRREFRGGPPLPAAPGHLLVMGGSQGARRINRALAAAAPALLQRHAALRIVHQCGRLDLDEMTAARGELTAPLRDRWEIAAFFADMASPIAAADLVVMRAGGSSLAEVSAMGRPMIVVPYPHAGDHQRHNVRPYAEAGAAVVVADEECDGARLEREITALLDDPGRWQTMAQRSREQGRPDATGAVVTLIREVAAAA